MTSSSPLSVAAPQAFPAGGDEPLGGELVVWNLAICFRCDPDLAQPFLDSEARDAWATEHVQRHGHTVMLTLAEPGGEGEVGQSVAAGTMHLAAMLRVDDNGNGYRWLCPTKGCENWHGPYATPEIALASWAGHSAKATITREIP